MAQTVNRFFTVSFSQEKARLNTEMPIISFWRHFLLECEGNEVRPDKINIQTTEI